jgi:translation initiation factor IF-1
MEVFYTYTDLSEEEGRRRVEVTQIIPMRGGLRGKGKKDVWVDPGSLVVIAATGLAQTTHEIVAVFTGGQIARLRKLKSDLDPRLFERENGATDDMFEIAEDEEEEVNVDDI